MARQRKDEPRLTVLDAGQPPIPIPVDDDGRETVVYLVDSDAAHAAMAPETIEEVLALAGAWSDLDWDEMVEVLDRIRHESKPTPPIDDL